MGSNTAVGSSLAVSAATPATLDATGYAALTFIEVGQVEKIGAIGASFAKVEFQPLKGAKHAFPKEYEGDVFLALHGSWNRATRTGSKVVRLRMKNGVPTGEYQDFMTGMIVSDKEVWVRPSSVLVAADGALLVDDDASGTIWRIVPDKQ